MPSRLLERRPDIAAAERSVETESALIGVAAAAYFPDINISGFFGWVGSKAFPISVANEVGQIGGTATEVLFNGGLRRAEVEAAEATYYQAVANYRLTVLTAFQQVEDGLSSLRILAHEAPLQDEAVRYSRKAVAVTINEYQAGTMSFTAVVTAEQTLLANEQTAINILQGRFVASVNLVEALGGGWELSQLPGYEQLRHWRSCVDVVGAIRGNVDTEIGLHFEAAVQTPRVWAGGSRLGRLFWRGCLALCGYGNALCPPRVVTRRSERPAAVPSRCSRPCRRCRRRQP